MLSFLKDLEAGFERLLSGFGHEAGALEAALVKNIAHDVTVLGGDAKSLLASDVTAIWGLVVATVKQELKNPALANDVYDLKIASAIKLLGGTVWSTVAPQVPGLAKATIETLARAAGAMIVSGVIGGL